MQRHPEMLEKQMDRNSMKTRGKWKAQPLGKKKALQQNRLGPADWEQLCRKGSEDTSLAVHPHNNLAPLSVAAEAMIQSEGLGRHLVQQPETHEMLLSAVLSLGLRCTTLTLTYWCDSIRAGAWDIQGESAGPRYVQPLRKGTLRGNMIAIFSCLTGENRRNAFERNWEKTYKRGDSPR